MISNVSGLLPEAGIDEAGRGCLAGPVVAAAVILPEKFSLKGLNDSKLLNAGQREEFGAIIKSQAISWAIGQATVEEIDRYNILQATFIAMHRAVSALSMSPVHLVIDGNWFKPFPFINHTCLVKGDQKAQHVAAASILAKTYRDQIMKDLDHAYPQYGWHRNKGYATAEHQKALETHGSCIHHRLSFSPVINSFSKSTQQASRQV